MLTYNEHLMKCVWRQQVVHHSMQYKDKSPFVYVPNVLNEEQIHYMIQLYLRILQREENKKTHFFNIIDI